MNTVISIPEISDEVLSERMKQIKWIVPAMKSTNGKAYRTSETNEQLYSLFYKESSTNPREQSFNFDESAIMTEEAKGLVPIVTESIYVKIGGYY